MLDQTHTAAAGYRRWLIVVALASGLFGALLGALTTADAVRAAVTPSGLTAITDIAPPYTANFTATGDVPVGQFGFDVAAVGDVNGDGIDDLLVGAPTGLARKAYLYLGGAAGLNSANVITIASPDALDTDQFGWTVAGRGDINHDGVNDFLVGAPSGDISGTGDVGLVYVYTGSVGAPTFAVTLTGESNNGNFGWSAAIIGHTNDDNYDDVAVGAWQGGVSDTGRVFVYAGRSDAQNLTPTLILEGEDAGDGFGVDVAGAGDIDGNGYDDLLVGAWHNDFGGNDAGKVYIYPGSADGITTTGYLSLHGPPDSGFGTSVAGAGDVNGDGYADILVGADVADSDIVIAGVNVLTDTGRTYLYLGSPTGPVSPPALVLDGEAQDNRFGFAVSGGGDLNGDGFDDFAVGAHQFDLSANPLDTEAGKAYAYSGCLGGPTSTTIFTATGESGGDSYGRSLAVAGDLNDDGVDDLVVGAFGAGMPPLGVPPVGEIYAYYGVDDGGCRASIVLTKTVALAQDPPICGSSDTITVTLGDSVTYCYQVRNTGTITLTHHYLVDSAEAAPIFERIVYTLTPGAELTHLISYTPAVSITHAVAWTAIVTVTGPSGIPALDPETVITATAGAQTTVIVTIPVTPPEGEPPLLLPSIRKQP